MPSTQAKQSATILNLGKTPAACLNETTTDETDAELRDVLRAAKERDTAKPATKKFRMWEIYSGSAAMANAFQNDGWEVQKLEIDTTIAYQTGATADSVQHFYISGGFDKWIAQAGGQGPDHIHASPPCLDFSFAVPPNKRNYDRGLETVYWFYLIFARYAKPGATFTMENPKNTLMSMPCTRLLRYTLADQCAYGRDWKKPTIFYNNSCYGLPLKLCPHPKGFKHAKALGGPNMKSAWNKKRIKSAIPLKLATDISAAVTDVHFKMRTCDATRTRQKQLTAEAMAIMVNALQNQGPTQPLKQRYVDTVDMAAGGTAQVLQEEDSISQAETEEIEVMDLTVEKQGVPQSKELEAEDGQPTTVIKNKKSREWFPSWQYEHQLKHMDATAKDARTLRAELIQARDAAQREEVKLECTITCLLCQAKIKAEACQRHIMKRFCDACWSSNHTRCKQMLKRIRQLGQHEQRAPDYKRIGNRTSSTFAMPEEKRKDKEEDISFRSARDVWKARLRSTKERRERDRQRDRKRVKALQETSQKHTKSTAVIIDKPEEEANNKKNRRRA